MNQPETNDQPSRHDAPVSATRRSMTGKSSVGAVVIVALVGIYSLARPQLNSRFGINLPALTTNSEGQVAIAPKSSNPPTTVISDNRSAQKSAFGDDQKTSSPKSPSATSPSGSSKISRQPGPLSSRMKPSKPNAKLPTTDTKRSSPQRSSGSAKPTSSSSGSNLRYGLLREIGSDRYLSPAGLLYTPGSAEGHRLEHLRRHTVDQPSRPGSHGVFDGGMEKALSVIDKAYERAKKGTRTTKKTDDGRTIYTVDMGGRIGFVGGRDGKRRRNPMARRVRLVLEGTRVITAYPM